VVDALDEWDSYGHDSLQEMLERWGITMQRPKEGLYVTDISISAAAGDMTDVQVTYRVLKTKRPQTSPGIPDRPVRTRLRSPEAVMVVGEGVVGYIDAEGDDEIVLDSDKMMR
jgi:hypothetical protein